MTYAEYVHGWLSYAALVIHFVVEKIWTTVGVPTPSSALAPAGDDDKDASHLLLGGGAYSRSSSSTLTPESSENDSTIVIIHHGSVAQFCGVPEVDEIVQHATLEEFCTPPPQNNQELLEYIDGYVGWLTSPRQDMKQTQSRRVSSVKNAKEFMQWLNSEPEEEKDDQFEKSSKTQVLGASDNQEEPEVDGHEALKNGFDATTAPWSTEMYSVA